MGKAGQLDAPQPFGNIRQPVLGQQGDVEAVLSASLFSQSPRSSSSVSRSINNVRGISMQVSATARLRGALKRPGNAARGKDDDGQWRDGHIQITV